MVATYCRICWACCISSRTLSSKPSRPSPASRTILFIALYHAMIEAKAEIFISSIRSSFMARQKPEYQVKIAKERIAILFDEARKTAASEPDLAKRYMLLAKRIAMRYNVRLGKL